MKISKLAKVLIFILYTYFIANSQLFAIGIAFPEELTVERCLRYFKFVSAQFTIIKTLFAIPYDIPHLVGNILSLLYLLYVIGLLAYPVRLWWRKKSVKHAWLVAMAGAFMPPYIYLYFFKDHRYTYYGLIVLNAGYGFAGLIGHEIRKRRKKQAAGRPGAAPAQPPGHQ